VMARSPDLEKNSSGNITHCGKEFAMLNLWLALSFAVIVLVLPVQEGWKYRKLDKQKEES